MSGTVASRFQGRFGYAPGLRAGTYAGQQSPAVLPSLPAAAVTPPAATPAAPEPVATPSVSVGSITAPEAAQGDGFDARGLDDRGPAPGDLSGAGVFGSGFGVSNYGTAGSVLGGLAGLATGVPGLGLAFGALGTYGDVTALNGQLSAMGLAPDISFAPAAVSNATFGLAGRSAGDQFGEIMGPEAFAEAPLSSFSEEDPAGLPADLSQQISDDFNFNDISQVSDLPTATVDPGSFGPDANAGGLGGYGATDSSANGGFGGENQFMRGGYTGAGHDGEVQPAAPAGTVHEGELVLPAHVVEHYGLPLLMGLLNGSMPQSRLAALVRGE